MRSAHTHPARRQNRIFAAACRAERRSAAREEMEFSAGEPRPGARLWCAVREHLNPQGRAHHIKPVD